MKCFFVNSQLSDRRCVLCGHLVLDERGVKMHFSTKHKDILPTYSCVTCNKTFGTFRYITSHLATIKHNIALKKQTSGSGSLLFKFCVKLVKPTVISLFCCNFLQY